MSWNNSDDERLGPFWKGYYDFAGLPDDFNRSGYNPISDYKVFYKLDAKGKVTTELAAVYLKVKGTEKILFADGTTISDEHYGDVDLTTKKLKQPTPSP